MHIKGVNAVHLFQTKSPLTEFRETAIKLGLRSLYVKRDDRMTAEFGGCKVRNLNRQLYCALQAGADTLLMTARSGSNAVAAASIFASRFNLDVVAILKPQVYSETARFNLDIIAASGTQILPVPAGTLLHRQSPVVVSEMNRLKEEGRTPYFIGFGGGDLDAAVAQAEAVIELAAQLQNEEIDRIYVAGASFSTAAGMAAGLAVSGLKAKLVIVGLAHEDAPGKDFFNKAAEVVKLIRDQELVSDGLIEIDEPVFHCAFELAFGEVTAPLAIESDLTEVAGLHLDPVYTRKVFKYMIQEAASHQNKRFLFWHTGNSQPWPETISLLEQKHRYTDLLIDL
ncbi:hypothetical protein TH53_06815 [Pedobacter lusitanus]|uniref:Tryptophan synthase beta chain-like PALP domain-containing protein n=1 Tax=Pedobacter lusitanus TaxID=1503925 RepID=A0A0D0FZB4_9SPHI|nr:pyridoxal-phosphate dependent enzyme [Pedobacter lusitanus]KIO77844.1 hypothetical protein TH53_06815 [Pedobacter lusitanus]